MKKLISLILCLMLLPVLAVQAAQPLVTDRAGLLTGQETASLESKAARLGETYDMDVAIFTIGSFVGTGTPEAFADDYFDANYGTDGVLFLLELNSRSWHISTLGTAADLLTDDDLIQIEEQVLPLLSDGWYFDAFGVFLDILPGYLEPEEDSLAGFLLIAAVPGAILAAVILAVMASLMNTKKPRHSAADYTVQGSYKLRLHQDLFLYSDLHKRARPKENKSGNTTHTSSSGRSHGGRGGKF